MKGKLIKMAVIGLSALSLMACGSNLTEDYTVDYSEYGRGSGPDTKLAVHDPSVIKAEGNYYIFGSHMSAAKSTDLINWEMLTDGYTKTNGVYTDVLNSDSGEFAWTGSKESIIPKSDNGYSVWAPDVIYNEKLQKYVMYSCTSSTFNASTITYSFSDSIEGPYEWQGNLIYSGENVDTIDNTDILDYVDKESAISKYTKKAGYEYNYNEYPNCIDPCVFYDAEGKMWMVYGSWSGGIFLLEVDESTGKVIHPGADDKDNSVDAYYGKRLLGGGHNSIEGPYILYDEQAGYYYLYVSYGELTNDGGYQIRVFRSEKVDGPYLDMNDEYPKMKAAHSYFGLKLSGNYMLPSLKMAYKATGHNSAFIDDDGRRYIVYHTRFDNGSEMHNPKAKQYLLNKEGWPCMLPYVTSGETASETGYKKADVVGRYYFINQGIDISGSVDEPVIVYLKKDGTVSGEDITGSWTMEDDSYYMTISYDETDYSGVFCKMNDESGNEVMTFSAVGNNESIWAVKYLVQ